jgi:hypothetical protein
VVFLKSIPRKTHQGRIKSPFTVYFGNVKMTSDHRVITASNRPFNVVGGTSLSIARTNAYDNLRLIQFRGMAYRSDFGLLTETCSVRYMKELGSSQALSAASIHFGSSANISSAFSHFIDA